MNEHPDQRISYVDPVGPLISTTDQVSDLVGDAWAQRAETVAVPVSRLDPDFFQLRSGFAGEFTQKMVNYRLKLAIVGDVSQWVSNSTAFGDFVRESNRGQHVWFLASNAELERRLAQ